MSRVLRFVAGSIFLWLTKKARLVGNSGPSFEYHSEFKMYAGPTLTPFQTIAICSKFCYSFNIFGIYYIRMYDTARVGSRVLYTSVNFNTTQRTSLQIIYQNCCARTVRTANASHVMDSLYVLIFRRIAARTIFTGANFTTTSDLQYITRLTELLWRYLNLLTLCLVLSLSELEQTCYLLAMDLYSGYTLIISDIAYIVLRSEICPVAKHWLYRNFL